jgi:hypothetical protein
VELIMDIGFPAGMAQDENVAMGMGTHIAHRQVKLKGLPEKEKQAGDTKPRTVKAKGRR